MSQDLASRRLYITDLARRQAAMETGEIRMHALTYRVLAKRLREAAAGFPEPALRKGFAALNPAWQGVLDEVLETRHFDHHGRLQGNGGAASGILFEALMARVRRSRRV